MRIECEYDGRYSIEVVDEGSHLQIIVEVDNTLRYVMLNEEKVRLLSSDINKWLLAKGNQNVANTD